MLIGANADRQLTRGTRLDRAPAVLGQTQQNLQQTVRIRQNKRKRLGKIPADYSRALAPVRLNDDSKVVQHLLERDVFPFLFHAGMQVQKGDLFERADQS